MRALAVIVCLTGCAPGPPVQQRPPPLSRNKATAHVVAVGERLAGLEADGAAGDLRLDNGLVSFVVDRADHALGFADSGGSLIDAAPEGGEDAVKQLFGYLADTFPRQPIHESTAITATDGEEAVVVARGHDSQDASIGIETRYTLRVGSRAVEITTVVHNRGKQPLVKYVVGDAIQWGRAERFAPGVAEALSGHHIIEAGFVIGYGERVAYAYVAPSSGDGIDGRLPGRHGSAWSDLNVGVIDVPPGEERQVKRWFVAAAADGAALLDDVARLRGESWAHVAGRVHDGAGVGLGGARIIFSGADGKPALLVRSRADGNFGARLPPGVYSARAEGLSRSSEPVDVTVAWNDTVANLTMSAQGELHLTVEDGGPAKLTLLGLDGTPDPHLGAPFDAPGGNVAFAVKGSVELAVAPGKYRLVTSRGPFFTVDDRVIEVPGQPISVALGPAVDLGPYLCADLHQHAAPSPDSGVSLVDRSASNLVEGLTLMVPTDHNMMADWAPAVSSLGGNQPLGLLLGNEATLDFVGHWNAYPLALRPGEPRGGALDVRGLSARQIVQGLRDADGKSDKVVQVNHPRAGVIGYFNNARFDRTKALPDGFETGYDAIEVFGGKDIEHVDGPLADWLSLLDRGLVFTAVGGSDSHAIAGQEVGYPRTCVAASTPAELVDGIKRRRDVFVTNGPKITLSADGKPMGSLVAAGQRNKIRVDIAVDTAPWIDVRRVEIFLADGARLPALMLPADAHHWQGSVEVPVTGHDGYIVAVARGDRSLEPVVSRHRGHPLPTPLAIANPIFIDGDGDGRYSAKWRLDKPPTPKPSR